MNGTKTTFWICLSLLIVMGGLFRQIRPGTVNAGNLAGRPTTVSCGPSGMLNLILQGPFVIDNSSNKFVLMNPDVSATHDQALVIDEHFTNPTGIQPGEYSLTLGDSQPGGAQICNPVAGTDLLMAPAKTLHLNSDPSGLHAFVVQLPAPAEIVPWNADPAQISDVSPVPPTTNVVRLATAVVLRYNYTPGGSVTFAGTEKTTGTKVSHDLTPFVYGKEAFIAIVQGEHHR